MEKFATSIPRQLHKMTFLTITNSAINKNKIELSTYERVEQIWCSEYNDESYKFNDKKNDRMLCFYTALAHERNTIHL